MKNIVSRFSLVSAALSLLLSACASAPAPADFYYSLSMQAPAQSSLLKPYFLVEPFQLAGVYSERPLLYRRGAALAQYHHQFWAEPPALMWRNALIDSLRASGAANVVTPETRVRADYTLRARIKRVELILDPTSPKAQLAMEIAVTDSASRTVLMLDFDEQQTLKSDDPEEYAASINQLAGRAFAQLNADLRKKLPKR